MNIAAELDSLAETLEAASKQARLLVEEMDRSASVEELTETLNRVMSRFASKAIDDTDSTM